jgi:hypothetical protein
MKFSNGWKKVFQGGRHNSFVANVIYRYLGAYESQTRRTAKRQSRQDGFIR